MWIAQAEKVKRYKFNSWMQTSDRIKTRGWKHRRLIGSGSNSCRYQQSNEQFKLLQSNEQCTLCSLYTAQIMQISAEQCTAEHECRHTRSLYKETFNKYQQSNEHTNSTNSTMQNVDTPDRYIKKRLTNFSGAMNNAQHNIVCCRLRHTSRSYYKILQDTMFT